MKYTPENCARSKIFLQDSNNPVGWTQINHVFEIDDVEKTVSFFPTSIKDIPILTTDNNVARCTINPVGCYVELNEKVLTKWQQS